jgi:hypothetical protein
VLFCLLYKMQHKETRSTVLQRNTRHASLESDLEVRTAAMRLDQLNKKEAKLNALRPIDFESLVENERLTRAVAMFRNNTMGLTQNKVADVWQVEKKKLGR